MAMRGSGLEKRVDYGLLSSFYGALLTDRQRSMLTLYCDEDFTVGEVAQQLQVTKQCVNDTLNRAFERLDWLEENLGLMKRLEQMREGMTLSRELITQAMANEPGQLEKLSQAADMIDKLLRQEEE